METLPTGDIGRDGLAEYFLRIVKAQKQGQARGVYSICSANRFVLEASMLQAKADGTAVCIESTSNQVNQFGGYMGMTPTQFVAFVREVAADMEFPFNRVLLGGDHLGPHVWQGESSEVAMSKARELIRQCVLAGYTKIHLDTSMRCAGDPADKDQRLPETIVMERAATLCQVAESACAESSTGSATPVYVIGTEVPVPGGEHQTEASVLVSRVEDVEQTISMARKAFFSQGLEAAWQRVIAVVVQPGVHFGDATVLEYDREKARQLSKVIEPYEKLVFEAHSTDYQTRSELKQMVEDHFALLKVGPWLTFAFREAVFALAQIEKEWLSGRRGKQLSLVPEALQKAMLENASHWKKHYHGDESYLRYAGKYSYSDRCRYYWPQPDVQQALSRLLSNLCQNPVPLTLLSQCLPVQYRAVREGRISNTPVDLIHNKIMEVIECYAYACGNG